MRPMPVAAIGRWRLLLPSLLPQALHFGGSQEHTPDVPQALTYRCNYGALEGVRIAGPRLDAEDQLLALLARNMQRSCQPVAKPQKIAQVLVEVRGIGRMMDLMMRRAEKQPAPWAREGDPELRMLQGADEEREEQHDGVGVGDRELLDRRSQQVVEGAARDAGEQRQDIVEHQRVDRVHTKIGQWGEDLGFVVDLMKLPEERNVVAEVVVDEIGELVGHEQRNRQNGHSGHLGE